MGDPRIVRRIQLRPSHASTGKTRHYFGTEPLSSPSELRIVIYQGDPGYYLFYCNSTGDVLTDTYHDKLSGAVDQAEWEFNVKDNEWEILLED